MKITEKDIQYVAELARLDLTPEETNSLVRDMESIIGYSMNKLSELDTEGIKPMEHVLPIKNVLREDKRMNSYTRDDMLENAPEKAEGCFMVPKVVE